MTGFARRPLALFVCCLFASAQVTHAAERVERALLLAADLPATKERGASVELLALNDKPLKLRAERKFNVLGKKKPDALSGVGISHPVELKKGDKYPTFVIADDIEGRTDEETVAIGDVELRKSGTLMYSDKMNYWPLEDEVEAIGNVKMLQEGVEVDTPYLRMKLSEQIGYADQVDYHIQKEVKSKFYHANAIVAVAATSNTSISGAPMMANVPNSYGLPTVAPISRPSEGIGHAERADFEGENQISLTNGTYSTCKPGEVDWYLRGSKIHLDYDEDIGEATHASVWFKDVPIFYAPSASFALNHERKSGFMHPFFSTSTKNGFDFTVPFYWNIAPNYDATIYTRHMNNRGFQLGTEAQYKNYNYLGVSKIEYMPNDEMLNRQRYAFNIQHQQNLGRGVSAVVNWQKVSDDNYWQDMSSRLLQTSAVQLPQQLTLGYAPSPWLQTNMQVLRYQTLQTDVANPVARPYFLEPQLNVIGYRPNVFKTDLSMIGQYSRFVNPDKVQGDRAVFYPQISLPVVHPAFQITPKVGLHMTKYALENQVSGQPDSLTRTLPVLSLDSTVIFERESRLLDLDYIQTLEPRLYYVKIPYKDQSQFPVFDSGLTDFNFAQVFAENRYSGFDRLNDANQLTAAITTRFLDANTGVERFKAMIGQRYYFAKQQVSLPGETARNVDFSNMIAAFTGLVLPKTYTDTAIEYNYKLGQVDRFSLGARFQPDYGRVLSASYRYTRDPLSLLPQVDQVDIAGQWPISSRWYAVGRYNYSLRDSQPLETVAGLEYNAGCWALRTVVQQVQAVSTTSTPNTTLYFQFELNDLGSVGSNPIGLLRRTIPGFGKINELPSSGALLNTQ